MGLQRARLVSPSHGEGSARPGHHKPVPVWVRSQNSPCPSSANIKQEIQIKQVPGGDAWDRGGVDVALLCRKSILMHLPEDPTEVTGEGAAHLPAKEINRHEGEVAKAIETGRKSLL